MENEEILVWISKLEDPTEDEAFKFSDKLAKTDSELVIDKLLPLLYSENPDTKYLAARTLGKLKNNEKALEPLLEAIHDKKNQHQNGGMVEALDNFDCSSKFVDIFRIYLFGNFKASGLAKVLLDSVEFDISPRTIRKAEKHFQHFLNNMGTDVMLEDKKQEAETILQEMKALFDGDDETSENE